MTRNYSKYGKNGRKNFSMGGPTEEELKAIPTRMLSTVEAGTIDKHLSSSADRGLPKMGATESIACFSERYLPTSRQARELTRADREGKTRKGGFENYDNFAKGGLVKKKGK